MCYLRMLSLMKLIRLQMSAFRLVSMRDRWILNMEPSYIEMYMFSPIKFSYRTCVASLKITLNVISRVCRLILTISTKVV